MKQPEDDKKTHQQLINENEELRMKLAEAEETLNAIIDGKIDAIVTPGLEGDQVFTLKGADYAYRLLVEAMNEGAATLTPDGILMYSNSRFAGMLGVSTRDIIGRSIFDFINPDELHDFSPFLERGMKGTEQAEFHLRSKDEQLIPVLVSCNPLKLDDTGLSIVITNLSEIKEAQRKLQRSHRELEKKVQERTRELKESEDRFRNFMDNSPGIAWIKDQEGRYVYVSRSYERQFGIGPDEWLGKTDFDIWPDDIARTIWNNDLAVMRGGEIRKVVETTRSRDGSCTYWWKFKFLIWDSSGQKFVAGSGMDITDRKRAEAKLARAHAILETLVTKAPIGIAYFDRELRFLMINDRLADINGIPAADHIGKRIRDVAPALDKSAREITRQILDTGQPVENRQVSGETPLAPGITRYWSESWFPVRDNTGEIIGFGSIVEEITDRRKAEEILKRDRETLSRMVNSQAEKLVDTATELEKAKRLSDIGALAATVAHELRNPLAAIGMAAHNIGRKTDLPYIHKRLKKIKNKVNESDHIINNLLFYSRIRPPHREDVNINQILNNCLATVENQSRKEVSLVPDLDSIRDVVIEADGIQLKEVFNNILNNALHAIPSQGGVIKITGRNGNGYIEIDITDNGDGMDKDTVDKIFDPFFTTKARGTGLGLSVSRQIIKLHRGDIEVSSEPGEYTSVLVRLPRKE